MIAFAKSFPQTGEALADLIAKNQDWPGAQEMTTRLAKIVAMKFPGIMTPDMKDVPPHVQAILSQMDQSIKQLTMERQALLMQLNDKNADRAVAREQIERSFEAKIIPPKDIYHELKVYDAASPLNKTQAAAEGGPEDDPHGDDPEDPDDLES